MKNKQNTPTHAQTNKPRQPHASPRPHLHRHTCTCRDQTNISSAICVHFPFPRPAFHAQLVAITWRPTTLSHGGPYDLPKGQSRAIAISQSSISSLMGLTKLWNYAKNHISFEYLFFFFFTLASGYKKGTHSPGPL